MILRILLVVSMLILISQLKAQDKTEKFNRAVDLVNCKVVEFSLKPTTDINDYKKVCPCNGQVGGGQIIAFLNGKSGYSKTIKVASEIEALKTHPITNQSLDDQKVFLGVTIFSDSTNFPKIHAFAEKRKSDTSFERFKSELAVEVAKVLANGERAPNSISQKKEAVNENNNLTVEDRVATLEEDYQKSTAKERSWLSDNLSLLVIVLLVLVLLLWILKLKELARSQKDENSGVSTQIRDYVKDKIKESGVLPNSEEYTIPNLELSSRIRKLEDQINSLRNNMENSNIPFEVIQPLYEQTVERDIKSYDIKSETFYLSTPNLDGSFNESSASLTYKEGASIYKFTKIASRRAKFQIDDREGSVKLALTYPDKNIDPVCDALNAFNPKANRISTRDAGEAELIGDKWVVNKSQKAKIRYEG